MRHFASRIIFAFCLFLSFLLMLYTVPGYSFAFFKYVAYLFFAVYLPGAFFFYKLCGRRLALLESLAVGVPLGLGIEFLIAMFSVMIHFRSFIFFLPVLGLGLFLLAVFRNKSQAWLPEYDLGILEACLVGSCIFGILYTIEHRGFMYTALISSAFSENHNIDALYSCC